MRKQDNQLMSVSRRDALTAAVGLAAVGAIGHGTQRTAQGQERIVKKGRIQSCSARNLLAKFSQNWAS